MCCYVFDTSQSFEQQPICCGFSMRCVTTILAIVGALFVTLGCLCLGQVFTNTPLNILQAPPSAYTVLGIMDCAFGGLALVSAIGLGIYQSINKRATPQ